MKFKVGDKIYSKFHQHGLLLMESINDPYVSVFKCKPIYFDGTIIDECDEENHNIAYLKKNYVPVSKIRKRKLDQLNKKLLDNKK